MKRIAILLTILLLPLCTSSGFEGGFVGGGGMNFYVANLDLAPINDELKAILMPQFDDWMVLYGGQAFAHLNYRLRIGGVGYSGRMRVSDHQNGYAREAVFGLGWGGALVEYIFYEIDRFELYAGTTLGWGIATITLEKRSEDVNWGDIWNSYNPVPNSEDNLSSTFKHSFFLLQPRLGVRYYLNSWLALCGSVDIPLVNLDGDSWTLSGNEVFGAPSLSLIAPFFLFGILVGG